MSFGGKGMRDWLIQRATAVWLGLFCIYFIYFFATHSPVQYSDWNALFKLPLMKVATIVSVFALVLHAWVGLWTVLTDYVHHTFVRMIFSAAILTVLFGYLIWTLMILWGL
jgi:succinate dehydrogenase / fumarate reductase membrane anchor subunit